jgi:hypothetical protein
VEAYEKSRNIWRVSSYQEIGWGWKFSRKVEAEKLLRNRWRLKSSQRQMDIMRSLPIDGMEV